MKNKLKLQPLRIPSGWEVTYNTFLEIDPSNIKQDEEWFMIFTESLFQAIYKSRNILIDLGWYPEGDPNGNFGIELIKNYEWEKPLESINSKDKDEIIEKLELLMLMVEEGDIR
ncbi:hypothetical protein [Gottfriedia solisilvae]|uniref:Uncharacterized protein n=1 Tax=Gottfriedia solisilvae TaxID=1516104 RepID=A0A8J3AJ69_9BACI|nr:hypothetical protein [Gottfriedia solisilvae]GGI11621.1 hypothetical protein GCM10007380_08760 [Gottfriedia solisilvae]